MSDNTKCPIWGTPAECRQEHDLNGIESQSAAQEWSFYSYVDSPRAGGEYQITNTATAILKSNNNNEGLKARLTTRLIDQRRLGTELLKIDSYTLDKIKTQRPLPVHDRADRLLKYLERESPAIGKSVPANIRNPADPKTMEMLAWSEALSIDEIDFLARYLSKQGWIFMTQYANGQFMPTILMEGYARLAELAVKHVNLSQGFVAMWFDDEMQEAYEKGIKPGIEDAGYTPLRIDEKEHINKIDDEIIAAIRCSRFFVADFTHGKDGARGGVYYEAGFAHGLNIPMFFTCRADKLDDLHFDTRQYNHIVWKTPEDLRKQLALRISAVIGDGTGKTH